MNSVAVASKLGFVWNDNKLIDNISFTVEHGESLAILGPNGCGKTTTLRCLCGLLTPTTGYSEIFDNRISSLNQNARAQVRKKIGVQTDSSNYSNLTAKENIIISARTYGFSKKAAIKRAENLLEIFSLEDRQNDFVGTFSKGMKQKVSIARALVGRPGLLVLDEPTSGLDPENARELYSYIDAIRHDNGVSVIMTSHRLHEIEKHITHAVFLGDGKSLAYGKIADLRGDGTNGLVCDLTFLDGQSVSEVKNWINHLDSLKNISISEMELDERSLKVWAPNENILASAMVEFTKTRALVSASVEKPTLSDLYFQYSGKGK